MSSPALNEPLASSIAHAVQAQEDADVVLPLAPASVSDHDNQARRPPLDTSAPLAPLASGWLPNSPVTDLVLCSDVTDQNPMPIAAVVELFKQIMSNYHSDTNPGRTTRRREAVCRCGVVVSVNQTRFLVIDVLHLTLMGVASVYQILITGILVILAVTTDQLSRRKG